MSGCLLAEYEISQMKEAGTLPEDGALIKTIVTTNLANDIAKYYNVSADYLLGLSDTPTLSVEEKAICDTIGLSQNSVDILKIHAQRARQTPVKDDESEDDWELIMWSYLSLQAINIIIGDPELLSDIASYFFTEYTHYTDFYGGDIYHPISSLELFDSKFHISYSNDYDFLSDAIFLRIQRTFSSIRKEFLQKLYKELQAYDTENEEYSQEIIYSTIRSLLEPLMKNLSHR